MFTEAEKQIIGTAAKPGYVSLASIATATPGGQPHVVPVRAVLDEAGEKVLVLGSSLAQSYKYRQVRRNPKVAIVWYGDNPVPERSILGVEVRGRAVVKNQDGEAGEAYFEVTPLKVFSWGVNEPAADSFDRKMGMDVSHLRGRYGERSWKETAPGEAQAPSA